jgi:hypothetical protein
MYKLDEAKQESRLFPTASTEVAVIWSLLFQSGKDLEIKLECNLKPSTRRAGEILL